jgi:hypothetical protein
LVAFQRKRFFMFTFFLFCHCWQIYNVFILGIIFKWAHQSWIKTTLTAQQGDKMSLRKNCPKRTPPHFGPS